jgi:hypothetical protein
MLILTRVDSDNRPLTLYKGAFYQFLDWSHEYIVAALNIASDILCKSETLILKTLISLMDCANVR